MDVSFLSYYHTFIHSIFECVEEPSWDSHPKSVIVDPSLFVCLLFLRSFHCSFFLLASLPSFISVFRFSLSLSTFRHFRHVQTLARWAPLFWHVLHTPPLENARWTWIVQARPPEGPELTSRPACSRHHLSYACRQDMGMKPPSETQALLAVYGALVSASRGTSRTRPLRFSIARKRAFGGGPKETPPQAK